MKKYVSFLLSVLVIVSVIASATVSVSALSVTNGESGDYKYKVYDGKYAELTEYISGKQDGDTYTIPSEIDGYTVRYLVRIVRQGFKLICCDKHGGHDCHVLILFVKVTGAVLQFGKPIGICSKRVFQIGDIAGKLKVSVSVGVGACHLGDLQCQIVDPCHYLLHSLQYITDGG